MDFDLPARSRPPQAPRKVSIEVCSECNHRCVYCPVRKDPFPPQVMDLVSFERILDQLGGLPRIERISLNHFNEPFLDSFIEDRIHRIVERRMTRWIILFTNASLLTPELIERLGTYRDWLDFSVNLPTVLSPERYRRLHGRDDLARVQDNLERLLAAGFSVRLSVQRNEYTTQDDLRSVQRAYRKRVRQIEIHASSTRGNLVLSRRVNNPARLAGCPNRRHTDYFHIGVDGAVFLCGEDYYKRYSFGNLLTQKLEDVLNSPERRRFIDYVEGKAAAPEGFPCRSCSYAASGGLSAVRRFVDFLRSRIPGGRL
jgi:radical SAM protein with 4Fe4S-binding SPASM domain